MSSGLVRIRMARPDDLDDIVQVHARAFPTFLMTRLGATFLRQYYTLVLTSPHGMAFIAEVRRQFAGFVVGYVNPQAFYRVLRTNSVRLAMAMLPALVHDPRLVRRVFASFRRADPREIGDRDGLAELSSVAVDPAHGRRGVGSHLVRCYVEEAQRRGVGGVYLTTDAEGNDTVNRFYTRLGFSCVRAFEAAGGRVMNEYRLAFEGSLSK